MNGFSLARRASRRHRIGQAPVPDGAIPAGLKLVHSVVSTTGVVIGTYESAGELVTGSF